MLTLSHFKGKRCIHPSLESLCPSFRTMQTKPISCCFFFKSFFRRSLKRQADMVCAKDGNCNIKYGEVKGTPCPACRVSRCLAVGMSLDGTLCRNYCNGFSPRYVVTSIKVNLTDPLSIMNRLSQLRYIYQWSLFFIWMLDIAHKKQQKNLRTSQ